MTNDFKIFPLCEDKELATFFCTDNDLNDFIHNDALQDMKRGYICCACCDNEFNGF